MQASARPAVFAPDPQLKLRDVVEPEEAGPVEGARFPQAGVGKPARDNVAQFVGAPVAGHAERRAYLRVGCLTRGGPRPAYDDRDRHDGDKDNYPDESSHSSPPLLSMPMNGLAVPEHRVAQAVGLV